jgi:pyridoxine kinase
MTVLSIQSAVTYGHVGNSAAVFALQRLGCEVWPLDTVVFSNHPRHGSLRGAATPPKRLRELLEGVADRNVLSRCEAVLSGYLGTAGNGDVVLDAVARVRAANPAALYCCDPVIGDTAQGLFVEPGIPEFFRDTAIPAADIVTPNQFELGWYRGAAVETLDDALAGARELLSRGPSLAVVTGLRLEDATITVLAVVADDAWRVTTPHVAGIAYGAGDAFTAIFLGRYLESRDPARALGLAASSVHALVAETAAVGADELQLIAAQDRIVEPDEIFPVERIA